MIVKELIEKLKEHPQNADVRILDTNSEDDYNLWSITVESHCNYICKCPNPDKECINGEVIIVGSE